jgi:hypothetical protein
MGKRKLFRRHYRQQWLDRDRLGKEWWKDILFLLWHDVLGTLRRQLDGFPEWKKGVYLKLFGKTCRHCEKNWTTRRKLFFHHRIPRETFKRIFKKLLPFLPGTVVQFLTNLLANNLVNMQLLCGDCHYRQHRTLAKRGWTTWRPVHLCRVQPHAQTKAKKQKPRSRWPWGDVDWGNWWSS